MWRPSPGSARRCRPPGTAWRSPVMKCSRAWSLGAGLSSGGSRVPGACGTPRGGTGPLGAVRLVRLIADHMREIHTGILAAARQDADVLLLTGLSTIGGYHLAGGLGLPSMGLALQPVYPTGEFPPSIVTARFLGRLGNRAAGQALVLLGAPALAGPGRELRAELGLPRLGTREAVFGQQDTEHWPGFCCFIQPGRCPAPGGLARRP